MAKTALITGIGSALAVQLHSQGYRIAEGAGKQTPLDEVQTTGQAADSLAWLLSDGSARVNGQLIAVDGDFTTIRPLAY